MGQQNSSQSTSAIPDLAQQQEQQQRQNEQDAAANNAAMGIQGIPTAKGGSQFNPQNWSPDEQGQAMMLLQGFTNIGKNIRAPILGG